ncbi:MAG: hypothetical protein AABY95_00890 [Pseudomonadota bacterium]
MCNEIISTIIGVIGAISGVWYGAHLSRKAARDLLAQQAKAEFAASFTDTIIKLQSKITEIGVGEALSILQAGHPVHFAAYIKLRSVIPKEQQGPVDKAWKEYTKDDKYNLPEERRFYRFAHVLYSDKDEHQYMQALKHVNRLIDAINA